MKEDKYVLESYKYVADSLQKELFCVEIKMIVIKISGVSAPPPHHLPLNKYGKMQATSRESSKALLVVCRPIDSAWTFGTSTLETYYLNFITMQLYTQNSPNSRKIQYWPPGSRLAI